MFDKNVWLLYPGGYYGSYLHWALCKANRKTANTTVDTPFKTDGSAHVHIKKPAHQTIEFIIQSIIKHRWSTGTIYPVGFRGNVTFDQNQKNWMKGWHNSVFWIMRIEEEPVIINVHDEDSEYHRKLGAINLHSKGLWNIRLLNDEEYGNPLDKDWIEGRNFMVDNWERIYPYNNHVLTQDTIDMFRERYNYGNTIRERDDIGGDSTAYDRKENDVYVTGKYVFNYSMREILDIEFISKFAADMESTNIADFDWGEVNFMHPQFITHNSKQIMIANNIWNTIKDKKHYENTSENILYEALVIDQMRREGVLCSGWEVMTLQEIIGKL